MENVYPLIFLLLPCGFLNAQVDSLLLDRDWVEEDGSLTLRFTPDGTFEFDYGERASRGRYLMGRYRLDSTETRLTLSVDYFLGKRRIPSRYRRGTDFFLEFDLKEVDRDRLRLHDRLTGKDRLFSGREARGPDPARRPLPPAAPTDWKLPADWKG